MKPTQVRIYVDIQGGCLQSIYGDPLPNDVEVEFILRDHDNIEDGDPDPLEGQPQPETYYW